MVVEKTPEKLKREVIHMISTELSTGRYVVERPLESCISKQKTPRKLKAAFGNK